MLFCVPMKSNKRLRKQSPRTKNMPYQLYGQALDAPAETEASAQEIGVIKYDATVSDLAFKLKLEAFQQQIWDDQARQIRDSRIRLERHQVIHVPAVNPSYLHSAVYPTVEGHPLFSTSALNLPSVPAAPAYTSETSIHPSTTESTIERRLRRKQAPAGETLREMRRRMSALELKQEMQLGVQQYLDGNISSTQVFL